jgi:hypothetical protein
MSAEKHVGGIPIVEELAKEGAPVWASLYLPISLFMIAIFAVLDIIPKTEVPSSGH